VPPFCARASISTTGALGDVTARAAGRRSVSKSGSSTRTIGRVPRGTVGQICARGDVVMMGYWNHLEETAKVIVDGWMHTGDAGHMDEDGFVYVVDRVKDMIISGGENVYSVEVENIAAAPCRG
jgi:acyl-CoA synthetase (AMP-forming)/AMP-acid ligase II